MASGKTENYGLSQWEATDQVVRGDFNADNAKIDAGMAENKAAAAAAKETAENLAAVAFTPENLPFVVGTYMGNAANSMTYGKIYTQKITLGFRPSMVLVWKPSACTYSSNEGMASCVGMASYGYPVSNSILTLDEDGFTVGNYMDSNSVKPTLNSYNTRYCYIAFR